MSTVEDIQQAKRTLRAEFLSRRKRLTQAERETLSARICERVDELPEIREANAIHIYWPMTSRSEVDTRPIIHRLAKVGKIVVLPVVTDFSDETEAGQRMQHRCFRSEAEMTINRWGVSEPVEGDSVPPGDLDLAIVPALGAGRNGHRIGYGRGYYDEFLRTVTVPTVCLVYSECFVPYIPPEPHDVPVSVIVTDREVIRTGAT